MTVTVLETIEHLDLAEPGCEYPQRADCPRPVTHRTDGTACHHLELLLCAPHGFRLRCEFGAAAVMSQLFRCLTCGAETDPALVRVVPL